MFIWIQVQQQQKAKCFPLPLHPCMHFSTLNSRGQPSIIYRTYRVSNPQETKSQFQGLHSYRHWRWRPPPGPWCPLCRETLCHSGLLRLPVPLRPPSHRLKKNNSLILVGKTNIWQSMSETNKDQSSKLKSIKISAAVSVSVQMSH